MGLRRPSVLIIQSVDGCRVSSSVQQILSTSCQATLRTHQLSDDDNDVLFNDIRESDCTLIVTTQGVFESEAKSQEFKKRLISLGVLLGRLGHSGSYLLCEKSRLPADSCRGFQVFEYEPGGDGTFESRLRKPISEIVQAIRTRFDFFREPVDGVELPAHATPRRFVVNERYKYETTISKNAQSQRSTASPTGHVAMTVPYDGHRHLKRNQIDQLKRVLRRVPLDKPVFAMIGHVRFANMDNTDLPLQLRRKLGSESSQKVHLPIRDGKLVSPDLLEFDLCEADLHVPFVPRWPKAAPISIKVSALNIEEVRGIEHMFSFAEALDRYEKLDGELRAVKRSNRKRDVLSRSLEDTGKEIDNHAASFVQQTTSDIEFRDVLRLQFDITVKTPSPSCVAWLERMTLDWPFGASENSLSTELRSPWSLLHEGDFSFLSHVHDGVVTPELREQFVIRDIDLSPGPTLVAYPDQNEWRIDDPECGQQLRYDAEKRQLFRRFTDNEDWSFLANVDFVGSLGWPLKHAPRKPLWKRLWLNRIGDVDERMLLFSGDISDEMRGELETYQVFLTPSPRITAEPTGAGWRVYDEERNVEYAIDRRQNAVYWREAPGGVGQEAFPSPWTFGYNPLEARFELNELRFNRSESDDEDHRSEPEIPEREYFGGGNSDRGNPKAHRADFTLQVPIDVGRASTLFDTNVLNGSITARIDAAISGISVEFQPSNSNGRGVERAKGTTWINVDFEIELRELLSRRCFLMYQHLSFDGVLLNEMRIADVMAIISESGFRPFQRTLPKVANVRRHLITSERTEGPSRLMIWVYVTGEVHETQRETTIPGGRRFKTGVAAGSSSAYLMGYVKKQRQTDNTERANRRLMQHMIEVHGQLKNRFCHVSTAD